MVDTYTYMCVCEKTRKETQEGRGWLLCCYQAEPVSSCAAELAKTNQKKGGGKKGSKHISHTFLQLPGWQATGNNKMLTKLKRDGSFLSAWLSGSAHSAAVCLKVPNQVSLSHPPTPLSLPLPFTPSILTSLV